MSADRAALKNLHDIVLHDIVVPGPAPWWPPAPGWYWVIGFVGLLGAVLLWRALVRWQRNCYRREALAELARIETAIKADGIARNETLPALAELLKCTALTAYPRERVAALTGPTWFAFLDQSGGTAFSAGLGAALAQGNYLTGESDLTGASDDAAERTADIAREIRRWIRQHGSLEVALPANKLPTEQQQSSEHGKAEVA